MSKKADRLPTHVLQRLTKYLVHLRALQQKGIEWSSSEKIGEALGLTSSTVRQDLTHLTFSGTAHRGYETDKLEQVLSRELGADDTTNAAIVGAGNLGRAVALHQELERSNFAIRAVFDSNPDVIGERVGDLQIKGMNQLSQTVRTEHITLGIITVPAASAKKVAHALIAAGIQGLLNFAPTHIKIAGTVPIVDARIVANLQELLYLMRQT